MNNQIFSSYTSVLISAERPGTKDYLLTSGGNRKAKRLNKWFFEPLKQRHFIKLIGGQGSTMHAALDGNECVRVTVRKHQRPTTSKTVKVYTDEQFIDAFKNLESGTTVWIAPGTYFIQQEQLYQHTFVDLENIIILATGVTVSGFKQGDAFSSVAEHKTQAFGFKNGDWRRMNPRDTRGPGSMVGASIPWESDEAIDQSELLAFRVRADGTIHHNAGGDIKFSNASSPALWRFVNCRNVFVKNLTVEGFNSVYPNSSAVGCVFDLVGCTNFVFFGCGFDRNGGCVLSAMKNGALPCNLIWCNECRFVDDNSEFTYLGIRHAGHTRFAGTAYFSHAENCSITNSQFAGVFMPILEINGTNNDFAHNFFGEARNNCVSIHGSTGAGVAVFSNQFIRCGNPLPSNEELATTGPTFWFSNTAHESGWNGSPAVLQFPGMSGGIAQGNRLGGTSTPKLLGGIYMFDNYVHVHGVDAGVDIITTVGLQLGDRAFSRFVAAGNEWVLEGTGTRTAAVVRHFETGGTTVHLANNLKAIEWEDNILAWDRVDDKTVFFGMRSMTSAEFSAMLAAAKTV